MHYRLSTYNAMSWIKECHLSELYSGHEINLSVGPHTRVGYL